jgi:hypothetical protein
MKDSKHNEQKKKNNKRTINDLKNTAQKTEDQATQTPLKTLRFPIHYKTRWYDNNCSMYKPRNIVHIYFPRIKDI